MKRRKHKAKKKHWIIVAIVVLIVVAIVATSGVGKKLRASHAKILFVGDIMFDRTIRTIAEKKGYDYMFSCVSGYFKDFDAVIGNLEGPITKNTSLSQGTKPGQANNTTFTFSPEVARALSRAGISAVSLGNNHIWDFGRVGSLSTRAALAEKKIVSFGAPDGALFATTTVGSARVALVSFNQFLGGSDPEKTVQAIWQAKRDSDFVVVFAHWGDEYVPTTEYQKSLAHRFIDAGADLVVGAHPHVVQESEIYQGKSIYYSLGNFIFDQYWQPEVRTGLGIEVRLKDGISEIHEVHFDIRKDGTTCLAE
ncbi:MAG TPA: CapA family protein [Candidatus Paceibacterota bacterium]